MGPQGLGARFITLFVAGLVLAVTGLSVPVGFLAASEHEAFSWEVAAIFGTALGTTLLAGFTAALALSTSSDVRATWELARLTREDQAARERPVVVNSSYWWVDEDEPGSSEVGGYIAVKIINIGLGPALDVVVEARFSTPYSGERHQPEPKSIWGGIERVMLPNESATFHLGVDFGAPTPDWADYAGADIRATYLDRHRSIRYDLDGNVVSSEDRIIWTDYTTLFVGPQGDPD